MRYFKIVGILTLLVLLCIEFGGLIFAQVSLDGPVTIYCHAYKIKKGLKIVPMHVIIHISSFMYRVPLITTGINL